MAEQMDKALNREHERRILDVRGFRALNIHRA